MRREQEGRGKNFTTDVHGISLLMFISGKERQLYMNRETLVIEKATVISMPVCLVRRHTRHIAVVTLLIVGNCGYGSLQAVE